MRDPSDPRFTKVNKLLVTGEMVGKDRPVGRVTWAKEGVQTVQAQNAGIGTLRYIELFTAPEVDAGPNVLSIEINRDTSQDSATCTIRIANQWSSSSRPEGIDTFGTVGYMTPGRGERIVGTPSIFETVTSLNADQYSDQQRFPTSWGYGSNLYRDAFIPNTVIRTYQGYGSDNFDVNGEQIYAHEVGDSGYVAPQHDKQLYKTGVWLIDKTTIDTNGVITLECRDLGKLLIEQYIYPPMVPTDRYPLIYCPSYGPTGDKGTPENVGRNVATFHSSSVDVWFGRNASVFGHRGSDAFDSSPGTFWLSVANGQRNAYYSYEWVQAKVTGGINEVTINTYGSNYVVYISVHENGVWQGADTVPYLPKPPGHPNGSNIKYVTKATMGNKETLTVTLPRTYNADFVRVCFTNLQDLKFAGFNYRAGLRDFQVRNHVGGTPSTFKPGQADGSIGADGTRYINDWTEPVKEMCAWGGFTWRDASPNPPDPLFGLSTQGKPLQVWGDFEILGAGPVVCTPGTYFTGKSFMQGIRQIADFTGCLFFIDEYGGANFRLPNIWTAGNYITDPQSHFLQAKIDGHPIEFHENVNLMEYQMQIDDSQVRSEILVVGGQPTVFSAGPVAGGYVLGYNSATNETSSIDFTDVLAGQNRLFAVPPDASALFFTERECQRMAELLALFILFSYRKGNFKAPAHPGLQVDDQIRIYERQTYEHYIHYVSGIRTSMDLENGAYDMQVTCHWLGKDPNTTWFVDKLQLTPAILNLPAVATRTGREASTDSFEIPPYGT